LIVPFISSISEKFTQFNSTEVKISFFSLDKLHEFIKAHKDTLSHDLNNVIYKMFCKICDAFYVGQMDKQFKTRISEHKNHIR